MASSDTNRQKTPARPADSAGRAVVGGAAAAVALVALAVRLPLLAAPGFHHDQEQFIQWAFVAESQGLPHVYDFYPTDRGPKRLSNYPPLQIYVCRTLASIYERIAGQPLDAELLQQIARREDNPQTRRAYVLFKLPAVMADAGLGALLVFWLSRRSSTRFAIAVAACYVLLPNVWHNSAVWGAVDGLLVLFILASLEAARRRRFDVMWPAAALAILTKPQAIIFLPLWLIASLAQFPFLFPRFAAASRGGDPRPETTDRTMPANGSIPPVGRSLALGGVLAASLIVAALLPFHSALGGIWDAYASSAGFYPFTHLNGFSLHFLFNPLLAPHLEGNLRAWYDLDRQPSWLGVVPRNWGFILFAAAVLLVVRRLWRDRCSESAFARASRVLPLAFFVLSTQMHERYLFPAVAAWAWSARPDRSWTASFALVSCCAAINVLWVWTGPIPLAATLDGLLHRPWFSQPVGVWCSLALLVVLGGALLDLLRRPANRT